MRPSHLSGALLALLLSVHASASQQLHPRPILLPNQFLPSPETAAPFQLPERRQHSFFGRPSHGCKHFCSISEPGSMLCWNATLDYYEQLLVGLLRRTVATQSNGVMWMVANERQIDFASLAKECYQRLKNVPMRQRVEDDNNWKSADFVFERLSGALLANVQEEVDKLLHNFYGPELPQLEVKCPNGCERAWDTWKWLFIGSLLVSLVLLAVLFLIVVRLDQQEQISLNMEAEEFRKVLRREGEEPRQNQFRTFRVV